MRARHLVATAAALTMTGAAFAGPSNGAANGAEAKAAPTVDVVAKGFVGPLSAARAPDGTTYVADTVAGRLYQLPDADGEPDVIYKSRKAAPEGVSADDGVLRFTTGSNDNSKGVLWTLDMEGTPVKLANIAKYEKAANPDAKNTYGFLDTPKSCTKQVKGIPASYSGVKESHPYGTASAAGVTYVADAGANAIFAVSEAGVVSTVTALKPVKVTITAAAAKANRLPKCVVGRKYAFEAVPTDIEIGPDGALYVTSLPGGPEDGSLGAHGRVLKVNPSTGRAKTVAGGLMSPTGVAVAANGDIYVTQLFAGLISKIKAGSSKVKPYAQVPLPAALEITPTGLLATINALPGKKPKGTLVSITP